MWSGPLQTNRRLRLRADTQGTDVNTVKYHGVRTVHPVVDISRPTEVTFELDWNHPENDCTMSAGIFICPTATNGNPEDEPNWVKVMYYGMDPGDLARIEISTQINGEQEGWLYDEGFYSNPKGKRTWRKIGVQHIRMVVSQQSITVWENNQLLCSCNLNQRTLMRLEGALPWSSAYLYLQQSSQSNYPAREVFFSNIMVHPTQALPIDQFVKAGPKLTMQPDGIPTTPPPTPGAPFAESFAAGQIDWTHWTLTRQNDFIESTIDVVGDTSKSTFAPARGYHRYRCNRWEIGQISRPAHREPGARYQQSHRDQIRAGLASSGDRLWHVGRDFHLPNSHERESGKRAELDQSDV